MGGPNEGGSTEDAELREQQVNEMKETRKTLMADPVFVGYYDKLKCKTTVELEEMAAKGNDPGNTFNPRNKEDDAVAAFNALHFLIYERKVLRGEWPLDKTSY